VIRGDQNAALLTFASAWILAMLNLLSRDRTLPTGFEPALLAALPLFALAASACVISFLPKIDISRRDPAARHDENGQHKNLLFFLDIASLPLPAYEAAARARYWPEPGNAAGGAYLSDLAREVAVNSRIVARKFRLFNLGARIVCWAIVILLAGNLARRRLDRALTLHQHRARRHLVLQLMAWARRRLVSGRPVGIPDPALPRRRQMARRNMHRLSMINRHRLRVDRASCQGSQRTQSKDS
jgi:hypothetical protein